MLRAAQAAIVATLVIPAIADAAEVKIPTGAGSVRSRPHELTVSADGSAYFGGSTGHMFEPRRRSPRDLGRLRWIQYGRNGARATGILWGLYGPGPLSADTKFEREGKVKLHAYRRRNGVFTRLTYSGRATIRASDGHVTHYKYRGTAHAQESHGRWYW